MYETAWSLPSALVSWTEIADHDSVYFDLSHTAEEMDGSGEAQQTIYSFTFVLNVLVA